MEPDRLLEVCSGDVLAIRIDGPRIHARQLYLGGDIDAGFGWALEQEVGLRKIAWSFGMWLGLIAHELLTSAALRSCYSNVGSDVACSRFRCRDSPGAMSAVRRWIPVGRPVFVPGGV